MIELRNVKKEYSKGQCSSERGIRKDRAGRVRLHRW